MLIWHDIGTSTFLYDGAKKPIHEISKLNFTSNELRKKIYKSDYFHPTDYMIQCI